MKVRDLEDGFPCMKPGCGKRVDAGCEGWDDPNGAAMEGEHIPMWKPSPGYARCDCGQLHRVRPTRVAVEPIEG